MPHFQWIHKQPTHDKTSFVALTTSEKITACPPTFVPFLQSNKVFMHRLLFQAFLFMQLVANKSS